MAYLRMSAVVIILLHGLLLSAQTVKIGTIDVYGNRNVSTDTILKYASISVGQSINQQTLLQKTIEKNIESKTGIKLVKTAVICCDQKGNYHLFIGVAETDTTILYNRPAPKLRIHLPEKYTNAYAQFSTRLSDAIQAGQATEDWSNGHSFIRYPPARRIQERYITWADEDFTALSKVLSTSSFANERATAAQIIAYNPDKNKVIPELMNAIIDQNDEVRNNAIRAISVIAYYSNLHPEKNIKIPYQPFIRLINSIIWSDRNKGLSVLMQLSHSRDKDLMNQLKTTSLPALKEMSLWKSEQHALPAYTILARMAGMTDHDIIKSTTGTNFADEAVKLVNSIE